MAINWDPEDEVTEVIQNLRTLLATASGTVPLARELGTPQDIIDTPSSLAGQRLRATVVKAVKTYEPRITIAAVKLAATHEGKLTATVEVA